MMLGLSSEKFVAVELSVTHVTDISVGLWEPAEQMVLVLFLHPV